MTEPFSRERWRRLGTMVSVDFSGDLLDAFSTRRGEVIVKGSDRSFSRRLHRVLKEETLPDLHHFRLKALPREFRGNVVTESRSQAALVDVLFTWDSLLICTSLSFPAKLLYWVANARKMEHADKTPKAKVTRGTTFPKISDTFHFSVGRLLAPRASHPFLYFPPLLMSLYSQPDNGLDSHTTPQQARQRLTINPSNPRLEALSLSSSSPTSSSIGSQQRRLPIRHLSLIAAEGESPHMHPSLPPFLSTLTSISTLHISWHSLDWNVLQHDQCQALTHLISLESLDVLEVVASQNFPLGLLPRFSGTKIYLTFTGTLIHQIPAQPSALTPGVISFLAPNRLSLVGQRNIVAFMQYFQNQPELSRGLRSLEFLSVTCIDDQDYFDSGRNLELLGRFLRFLDRSKIKELRVQDERPRSMIGHGLGLQDIASLRHVKNMEVHLCVKHVESPREVYSAFREWFISLLSGLSTGSSSSKLACLDITYQVLFPRQPPWLTALIQSMEQLWQELDGYLARRFPRLRQVNLGFQFHDVGGHEQWMEFNAENQPSQLNERGLDCSFWVRDI